MAAMDAAANFSRLDRSELDDLLDEILADELSLNNIASDSFLVSGFQQRPSRDGNVTQWSNGGQTASSWDTNGSLKSAAAVTESDKQYKMRNDQNVEIEIAFNQKGNQSNSTNYINEDWNKDITDKSDSSMLITSPYSKHRGSLPANNVPIEHQRRRMQSVPYRDYGFDSTNLGFHQDYRTSSRSDAEEQPSTWLDQQKQKLRQKQEGQTWKSRTEQEKRLVEELKSAQTVYIQNHPQEDDSLGNSIERHAELISSHYVHSSPSIKKSERMVASDNSETVKPSTASKQFEKKLSDILEAQQSKKFVEPKTVKESGENSPCKAEKSYYVSGIERPPFTTHQTKYFFSISTPQPPASASTMMSPNPCTKLSPPTPQRGQSSRQAVQQTILQDWGLHQWEQDSDATPLNFDYFDDILKIEEDTDRVPLPHQNFIFENDPLLSAVQSMFSETKDSPSRTGSRKTDRLSMDSVDHRNTQPVDHRSDLSADHRSGQSFDQRSGQSFDNRSGKSVNQRSDNMSGQTFDNRNGQSIDHRSGQSVDHRSGQSLDQRSGQLFDNRSGQSVDQRSGQSFDNRRDQSVNQRSDNMSGQTFDNRNGQSIDHRSGQSVDHRSGQSVDYRNDQLVNQRNNQFIDNRNAQLVDLRNDQFIDKRSDQFVDFRNDQFVDQKNNQFVDHRNDQFLDRRNDRFVDHRNDQFVDRRNDQFDNRINQSVNHRNGQFLDQRNGQSETANKSRNFSDLADHQQIHAEKQSVLNSNMETKRNGGEKDDSEDLISLHLIGQGMQNLETMDSLLAVKSSNSFQQGRTGPEDAYRANISQQNLEQKWTSERNSDNVARHKMAEMNEKDRELAYRSHSADMFGTKNKTPVQLMDNLGSASVNDRSMDDVFDENIGSGHMQRHSTSGLEEVGNFKSKKTTKKVSHVNEGFTSLDQTKDLVDGMDNGYRMFDAEVEYNGNVEDGKKLMTEGSTVDQQNGNVEYTTLMLNTNLAQKRLSASSYASPTPVQSSKVGFFGSSSYSSQETAELSPGNQNSSLADHEAYLRQYCTGQMSPTNVAGGTLTPRFIRGSSKLWHKSNISRDEAINYLKDKEPGNFVVRNSNSFPGAFGLALKVARLPPNIKSKGGDPQAELVRHFLIEPTSKGVRLKGCSNEPVFGSLAALVYQHSLTPLSLPCKLIMPPDCEAAAVDSEGTESKPATTASEVLSQGAACNVLYLTSVDMESLTGPEAVGKAVGTMLYAASSSSPDSANFPKTTFVHFKVSAQGITLTDINRRLFFRRHYPVDTVTFAGMDPEDRRWTWTSEETKKQVSARVFGFVARKHGSATDNACHVFAELDPDQPADAIANFIMKVMLGHHGRAKKHVVT